MLGGDQHAYPGAEGEPGAAWFPALESLLRKAVRASVPTLGICLGGQLLATAHSGLVEPAAAGPEIGARLVARRDAADWDPLFAPLPMLQDVLQWHHDEVSELPVGAVLLAASTDYPHQAFRVGQRAWGLQFHIECDVAMIADWVSTNLSGARGDWPHPGGGARPGRGGDGSPGRDLAAVRRAFRGPGTGRIGAAGSATGARASPAGCLTRR